MIITFVSSDKKYTKTPIFKYKESSDNTLDLTVENQIPMHTSPIGKNLMPFILHDCTVVPLDTNISVMNVFDCKKNVVYEFSLQILQTGAKLFPQKSRPEKKLSQQSKSLHGNSHFLIPGRLERDFE